MDAPLGGDALRGFPPLLPKSLLQIQLFRLLRVPDPAAQAAAGSADAVFAPVPGGGDRPAVSYLCTLPAKGKFPALGTGGTVLLRIADHVFHPADLLLKVPPLLLVIVGGLDQTRLAGGVQIEIIVQALIPGVHHNFLIPGLMEVPPNAAGMA